MVSKETALAIAKELGVTFDQFTLEEFTAGINVELEHGSMYPSTNVTDDNLITTTKIALAHLHEFPNYYNSEYGIKKWEEYLTLKLKSKC